MNAGAPFVDTHATYCLDNVIGSVVPGTAKIEDGRGVATILLSAAPGVADTVQKIREGVIRNISVGYWLHKVVKTEADDGSVARHEVVDWEPLEISAVPVPADAGSQIRSAEGEEGEAMTRSSCLIVTRNLASRPNTPATSETPMASRTPKNAAPKGTRTAKSPAEIEAEKKRKAEERKAALRAAARDEDEAETESEDEERDDEEDEERSEDESENGDGGSDDERDGDDEEDEERSEDCDDEEDEGERSATTTAARRAAEAAVKAERKRMASITEMAERAGLPKMGRKHIDQGTSAKRFGELVLERMLKNQEKRGNATFAGNGSEEISRERSSGRQGREQRDLSEGEAHWRRVAGKPAKAA